MWVVVTSRMQYLPSSMRTFIVIAVFCVVTILISRNISFDNLLEPLSGIMKLSRTCDPADDHVNLDTDRKICRPMLKGARRRRGQQPHTVSMTANDYVQLATTDCDCFRSTLGYFTAMDTSAEERAFPIAFTLLTYEHLEQTERLLRLVYRPHNVYCIHVDRKSNPAMHRGMEAMAGCLPNVMIARPAINVTWGGITVVQAEMLCMGYLLAHSVRWKYLINLVGRDMPLRTNEELVKILKAYGGANEIQGVE